MNLKRKCRKSHFDLVFKASSLYLEMLLMRQTILKCLLDLKFLSKKSRQRCKFF